MKLLKTLLTKLFILILLSSVCIAFAQMKKEPASATLLIFIGSDWCSNCRRLEKKILSDSVFISFARDRFSIEFADFPQHKKLEKSIVERNKALAEKYHFQGVYPTILLLDSAKNIQAEIFFRNQNSSEFIEELKLHLKHEPTPKSAL